MVGEDYYWELKIEKGAFQAIGPKRTIEFFLDAVKRGREYILQVHNPAKINELQLRKEALKVIRRFRLRDANMEQVLAKLLTNAIKVKEHGKQVIVSEYVSDLLGRFLWTPGLSSIHDRAIEYASFRASGDLITLTYGLRSKPELPLTKVEAEYLKKSFAEGKNQMKVKDFLNNGRRFYNRSSEVAEYVINSMPFLKLSDLEKRRWESRARIDRKLSDNYLDYIEILRTANYRFFN